jgi:hypothetical protein
MAIWTPFFSPKENLCMIQSPIFWGVANWRKLATKKNTLVLFRQWGSTHSHVQGSMDERPECRVPHPQHGCMFRVLSRGRREDSGGCVCFAVGMRLWTSALPLKSSHDQSQRNTLKWVCSRSVFFKKKKVWSRLVANHAREDLAKFG